MAAERRLALANVALSGNEVPPPCPFQPNGGPCRKPGGVDLSFFASVGGASAEASRDLGDGDVIWMVVGVQRDAAGHHHLMRHHWEVETLEASCDRLLAARTVPQQTFLDLLREKLRPIEPRRSVVDED